MILTNILQISTDTTRTLSDETLLGTQNTVNVIDIAMKGGWIMVILLALSILAIYVFTNRILLLRKAMKNPEVILEKVKTAVKNGDLETATIVCRDEDTPAARMIMAGLNNITSSLKNIEAAIENVGKIEIYRLEKKCFNFSNDFRCSTHDRLFWNSTWYDSGFYIHRSRRRFCKSQITFFRYL